MLRITETIELKLRKHDSRFSLELLKGLALALLIHLVLFAAFRIAPLPNLDIVKPLTPIAVETELPLDSVEILPVNSRHPSLEILEPPHYGLTVAPVTDKIYRVKQMGIKEPNFSEIESMNYTPIFIGEDD